MLTNGFENQNVYFTTHSRYAKMSIQPVNPPRPGHLQKYSDDLATHAQYGSLEQPEPKP